MLIHHRGAQPAVDPSAYVAPNAVLCGDVRVGADARILFGAVLTAEDGRVDVGERTVVMEHALVRGRGRTPAVLGDDVLIGPHAHVNGAAVEDGAFLATGTSVFPGAVVGANSEVRINAVVHVNSKLAPETTVPIGWIAAGAPARLFSPDRHEELWAVQEPLDFPGTVYGLSRDASARERMARQSAWFGAHRDDRIV
jgi:carbonic anhydrase/acetyltransferase-like protein (isoleucine patch superfamily)